MTSLQARSRSCWRISVLAAATILGSAGALGVSTAASSPSASAAGTCAVPRDSYPGTGYFTSLSVSGTSCASGLKLAKAYYRCRLRHGRAGKCSGKVAGYKCSDHRNSIPTEIDGRVSCRKGGKTVVHTYQQFT